MTQKHTNGKGKKFYKKTGKTSEGSLGRAGEHQGSNRERMHKRSARKAWGGKRNTKGQEMSIKKKKKKQGKTEKETRDVQGNRKRINQGKEGGKNAAGKQAKLGGKRKPDLNGKE